MAIELAAHCVSGDPSCQAGFNWLLTNFWSFFSDDPAQFVCVFSHHGVLLSGDILRGLAQGQWLREKLRLLRLQAFVLDSQCESFIHVLCDRFGYCIIQDPGGTSSGEVRLYRGIVTLNVMGVPIAPLESTVSEEELRQVDRKAAALVVS